MKREEIKSYKDACKVIGRKPRTYKDKHLNLYEQFSTIIAALNFISNGNKPYIPKLEYYYIYSYQHHKNVCDKTKCSFSLRYFLALGDSHSYHGSYLKIKEKEDGIYIIKNFREMLQDWFWSY